MRVFFLMNACQFTKELRERQILRGLGLLAIVTLIAAGHLQQVGRLPVVSFGHSSQAAESMVTPNVTPPLLVAIPTTPPATKITPPTNSLQLPPKWSLEKGTISGSFNTSAHLAGLTNTEIKQLNHIFADKIDFHHLSKGDNFRVITERNMSLNLKKQVLDNVIGAEFTVGHHPYTAIRYVGQNGQSTYLQMDGSGLAPGFLRYPVHYTRIGSGFNLHRLDPVTGVYHAHAAIDFDAPTGTPIQATGDGKISFAAYEQGYGNVIKINHAGQVMTLYAHMRNFANGIHPGVAVSKGQVIGFVGTSGYTTGPHVHYELHFGAKAVNPLTTKLPTAAPVLSSADRSNFKKLVNQLKPFLS